MGVTTYVVVTCDWIGFHFFPEAAGDVAFLRNTHRHKFFIKVICEVAHDNREIEFFQLQRKLKQWLPPDETDLGTTSCEQLAKFLLEKLLSEYGKERTYIVEVWEDKENGAIVQYSPRDQARCLLT